MRITVYSLKMVMQDLYHPTLSPHFRHSHRAPMARDIVLQSTALWLVEAEAAAATGQANLGAFLGFLGPFFWFYRLSRLFRPFFRFL